MSIKQSIAALLVLMSVSFSAFAVSDYLRITRVYASDASGKCTGLSQGDIVSASYNVSFGGASYDADLTCDNAYAYGDIIYVKYRFRGNSGTIQILADYVESCPAGEVINPETGKCEEPPVPFCQQSDTLNQISQFEQSCWNEGVGFTPEISCNDSTESLVMSCAPPPPTGCEPGSPSYPGCLDDENKCDENHPDWDPRYGMCCSPENNYCDVSPPESCTIFSANWPECSGDVSIDPPSGGDLGKPSLPDGGASGGDGSGSTDSNKPEPDVDNTSDELSAIKSMNDDLNSQLNAINNDMNKNQAETKSALDALKASTDLNTQSVIDGANHVADALDGQSDMLSGIGNKTNQYLKSINSLLNNGFGELANGLNGVGSGLDGLSATNQQGFGDVVEAIEGLGDPLVNPDLGSSSKELYSGSSYTALQGEVDVLKAEYEDMLNQYRTYFSFNQGVNSGQYDSHDIDLNWHGTAINKSNQVMASMRDNAGIISAVVLFIFGMMGIRAISGAF